MFPTKKCKYTKEFLFIYYTVLSLLVNNNNSHEREQDFTSTTITL